MPHRCTTPETPIGDSVPSKLMNALPENIGPVFFQNQFRTKIELPTPDRYSNNVEGKCAVITGSNTGLGFQAAKQLLSLGLSHLIMGVRSLERGHRAASELRLLASRPGARVDVYALDMESYESVQAFARRCDEELPRIDMVILNAGLAPMHFETAPSTAHEKTIQINHLSTALLAILLLPILKAKTRGGSEPPRLTIVNSLTAHLCKLPNKDQRPFIPSFDDTAITPWDPEERYGASKLLSQLFTVKLAESVSRDDVILNMVDPGLTKGTGLARDAKGAFGLAVKAFLLVAGRPVDRGAATYLDAVLAQGKESHGCFLMNCKISPLSRWYYSDGETLGDLVWRETLQELKFAGVDQILASL